MLGRRHSREIAKLKTLKTCVVPTKTEANEEDWDSLKYNSTKLGNIQ